MKSKNSSFTFFVFSLLFLFVCSCSNHPCVKHWEGQYKRDGQNTWESWTFDIKNNGNCYAKEIGSGDANYEREYYGKWSPVSDDVILLEMETGEIPATFTKGDGVFNHRMANFNQRFYIRKDGAADPFYERLDNPKLWLK